MVVKELVVLDGLQLMMGFLIAWKMSSAVENCSNSTEIPREDERMRTHHSSNESSEDHANDFCEM